MRQILNRLVRGWASTTIAISNAVQIFLPCVTVIAVFSEIFDNKCEELTCIGWLANDKDK